MKKLIAFTIVVATMLTLISCGSMKYLPVSVSKRQSFSKYEYVYVDHMRSNGSFSSDGCDMLAGMLMKKGFVVLSQFDYLDLEPSKANKTMVAIVGVGRKRAMGLFGDQTAQEVTLQFVSASTNDLICVCTCEGSSSSGTPWGNVEAAVVRCVESLFP